MHAVLWDFVDAARRRLLVDAVEMVERSRALADGVSLLDGFCDVGLGEQPGHRVRHKTRITEIRVAISESAPPKATRLATRPMRFVQICFVQIGVIETVTALSHFIMRDFIMTKPMIIPEVFPRRGAFPAPSLCEGMRRL